MIPARRKSDPYMLVVGMASVKTGDRVLFLGCAHGGRLGAVASKVGLSGNAVAIVADESSAERAQRGAAEAGALVEISVAPPTDLPVEGEAFDLVILDDTGGFLALRSEEERAAVAREAFRGLVPGGRLMIVNALPPAGLRAIFARGETTPLVDPQPALEAGGFKFARVLGERERLRFTEGVKPRATR